MKGIHKLRRNIACCAFHGDIITWNDVETYMDETFFSALDKWYHTKLWGLPNGSIGWANEPSDCMDAITLIENEKNVIEVEEMEKRTASMGNKSKGT